MGAGRVFVENFLEHRIYDPVKAHEYYERTKQLKGRNRKPLRGIKKEGWAYVQSVVRDQKKEELKTLSEKNKANTEALRATAKSRRDEISAQIKNLLASVSADVKSKIDALPKNLSKEERAAQIAQIRAAGNNAKDTNRSARDVEREKLISDLKTTIDDARQQYNASKEAVKAKYETVLDREYEALATGSAR